MKPKRKRKQFSVVQTAKRLQKSPPKSELWFRDKWEAIGVKHEQDRYNSIFSGFIPDVINHKYKYIIEIDGEIHKRLVKRDKWRDKILTSKGYQVYRINAFKDDEFESLVNIIERHRLRVS